jgi:hypothetical protein
MLGHEGGVGVGVGCVSWGGVGVNRRRYMKCDS